MTGKISAVINTFNEEENIGGVIKNLGWVDEILVCDMHSDDKTVSVARELGAKVILHKRVGYVEPARNFAISKASGDWILILDADEQIPDDLADKLKEMAKKPIEASFVEIPRKNIIFGHVMKASGWWPDYHVRFFRKGAVRWNEKIHSKPETHGFSLTLPAEEKWAITHQNYKTIYQFIDRLNRYSGIEAHELKDKGYVFNWRDLVQKPLSEFLSRFFANKGYQDGLHGLALSILQAFSFLIVYLKVWEISKFKEEEINLSDLKNEVEISGKAVEYWFNSENQTSLLLRNKSFLKKIYKIFKK